TATALRYYGLHFVPANEASVPRTLAALGVVCADTKAEAEHLFASTRLLIRRIRQGERLPIPTPEEALVQLGSGPDPFASEISDWPRYFVGTPEQVRPQLERMAEAIQTEELMVVTVIHSHAARM